MQREGLRPKAAVPVLSVVMGLPVLTDDAGVLGPLHLVEPPLELTVRRGPLAPHLLALAIQHGTSS